MPPSPITVRPFATPTELDAYLSLADQAFSNTPSPEGVAEWRTVILTMPGYDANLLRGAFLAEQLVGGYYMQRRLMQVGAATLLVACIGAVVVDPQVRKQHVATTLMHDAITYTQDHNYDLLLLDGIPKFYYRYGYSDVFELSTVDINRAAILACEPAAHATRKATLEDAEEMLTLYDRHYTSYTGSFVRSIEQQAHFLRYQDKENPPILAISPEKRVEGFLLLSNTRQGQELVADNWSATITLLRYHAQQFEADPSPPIALTLRSYPAAPEIQWMIDRLEIPDINSSSWGAPTEEWSVRTVTYHHRYTGWMARLVRLSTTMNNLLPALQSRWHESLATWHGTIALQVGEETSVLRIAGRELQLVEQATNDTPTILLSPQAFVQVLFGYRTIAYHSKQPLAPDLQAVLTILFPAGQTWIPATDWF